MRKRKSVWKEVPRPMRLIVAAPSQIFAIITSKYPHTQNGFCVYKSKELLTILAWRISALKWRRRRRMLLAGHMLGGAVYDWKTWNWKLPSITFGIFSCLVKEVQKCVNVRVRLSTSLQSCQNEVLKGRSCPLNVMINCHADVAGDAICPTQFCVPIHWQKPQCCHWFKRLKTIKVLHNRGTTTSRYHCWERCHV